MGQNKFDQVRAIFSRREEEVLAMDKRVYPHGYIPSWTPDWSKPGFERLHLLLKNRERCHFQASGDTKVRLHPAANENWLILEGFTVGRVKAKYPMVADHGLNQF